MAVATTDAGDAPGSEWTARIDGYVQRARDAAERCASSTRRRSTGSSGRWSSRGSSTRSSSPSWRWRRPASGCFEDKVVKNYIATEFLYDYLKDKKSVGVIDEDPSADRVRRRADRRRARAAADHQPDLDRAVQVDRRREDAQRDDLPPVGARRALRDARGRDAPGGRRGRRAAARRAAGDPRPDARRLPVPLPPPGRRLHLDDRRPEGGRGRERGRQAVPQRRRRATRRSTCTAAPTSGMAVVDILVSKTFDASVICPAEQTCVIDDADLRRGRSTSSSGWARGCSATRRQRRWRRSRSTDDGSVEMQALGQSCVESRRARRLRGRLTTRTRCCSRRCRRPRRARRASVHAEKLMPVLGLVRSPSVEHGIAACELVTEHGGLGHTSAVYASDEDVIDRFALRDPDRPDPRQRADRRRRARRRLQLDDADVLARLRHLGRLEHDRQRQLPQPAQHQGGLAPPDAAAVVPRARRTRTSTRARSRACGSSAPPAVIVTDGPTEARGVVDEVRRHLGHDAVHVFSRGRARADRGADPRGRGELEPLDADAIIAVGGGSVIDAAKAMRLFHESPELSCASSRCRSSTPASGSRRTRRSSTPSSWSRSRRRRAPARRSPRPRCSRRPAKGHARRLLAGPRHGDRRSDADAHDAADDHRRHRHRRADARARGCRLDLRLPVHRRLLHAGGQPDPRARSRARTPTAPTSRPAPRWPTRRRSPGSRSRTRSWASTTRSRTRSAPASASPTAARTRSSCRTCCATTPRCRASSCRRPATRRTSRRRSTRRSRGSSASAASPRRSRRERLFARVDELLAEVASRARSPSSAYPGTSSSPRSPTSPGRLQRPEHPHQPAHPAGRGDGRAAAGGLRLLMTRRTPATIRVGGPGQTRGCVTERPPPRRSHVDSAVDAPDLSGDVA